MQNRPTKLDAIKVARYHIKKMLVQGKVAEVDQLYQQTQWGSKKEQRRNLLLMWSLAGKVKLPLASKQWLKGQEGVTLLAIALEHNQHGPAGLLRIAKYNEDLFGNIVELANSSHDQRLRFNVLWATMHFKSANLRKQTEFVEMWQCLLAGQHLDGYSFATLVMETIKADNEAGLAWLKQVNQRGKRNIFFDSQGLGSTPEFALIYRGLRNMTGKTVSVEYVMTAIRGLQAEEIAWQHLQDLPNLHQPTVVMEAKAKLAKTTLEQTIGPAETGKKTSSPLPRL